MTPPPPAQPPATDYPIAFTFDPPARIARWRPLVHWLLAIPHFIVLYALAIVASVVVFVAWIVGVVTGRIPEGLLGVITMYSRYNIRVSNYLLFLQPQYPPFEFSTSFTDPGTYPHTRYDVVPDLGGRSRLTIFFRYFMIIPHAIVLWFLIIGLYFVMIVGFFAVLVLGRWPAGLLSFVVGVQRWGSRVSGYFYLLTDRYPPFSLS